MTNVKKFVPAIESSLNLLHLIGLNPYKANSIFAKIRLYLAIISITMGMLFNLPYVLIDFRGIESFKNVEFLPEFILTLIRFYVTAYKQTSVVELLGDLSNFWPINKFGFTSHEAKASKLHTYTHNCLKMFTGFIIFNFAIFMIPCAYYKKLMFPPYYYCVANATPCYEIHQIWQIGMATMQIMPLFAGTDFIFISFIVHIYSGLELIKTALKNLQLVPRCSEEIEICNKRLVLIIKQHDFIMSFIRKISKHYSTFFLLQFATSGVSMILSLYMITSDGVPPKLENAIRFGIVWFALLIQASFFSIAGSVIYEQTASVAFAVYDLEWYHPKQSKLRNKLAFIIQRAQKEERLRVGNMSDLNLLFLAQTIKTTLSIYTLLLTLETTANK